MKTCSLGMVIGFGGIPGAASRLLHVALIPPLLSANRMQLEDWRSHFVISNLSAKMSLRHPPYLFTEQGFAMLSSVLRSKRAAEVNVAIMRTFVRLRQLLATNRELARKLQEHHQKIGVLFDAVQKLLAPPPAKKKPIGFVPS